ncbi:hypothetical protein FJT64_008600 [Amphibalanus amphitrite]|uniref:Uncharacterized protein n=1 Tax=Amphibalanus amphitrite TaxID=1232801 RepID=A0A6A4VSG3_AMPAM|nr:hypothetical protein FJT64_008600 [Amphibalanus amphitrite]
MGHMKPNSAEPLDAEDQARRRRRAAASSDDDRLAAFARDLSDSWYSDLPPKLDAGGVSTSNANKKSTFIRLFSHRVKRTTPRGRPANSNERSEGHTRAVSGERGAARHGKAIPARAPGDRAASAAGAPPSPPPRLHRRH